MKKEYEIEKDFYCVLGDGVIGHSHLCCAFCTDCPLKRRKYPTPEQYEKEYSEEVPDYMPVWYMWIPGSIDAKWELGIYREVKSHWEDGEYGKLMTETPFFIICACTPFPKPDNDWRPE